MKLEKAKLMQLEIEKKRKLPKKVKDSINANIFQILICAIIILSYLCAINITYYKTTNIKFEEYMKYYALGIILVTVFVFEFSYRKSSIKFMIIGIELLLCGIFSLYIPYIYLHTTDSLRNSIMILPGIFIFYYAIKAMFIFKQQEFKYQNSLSDVKEIVKDTENTSYIDEDSTKSFREKTIEAEEIRKAILRNQEIRKQKKQKRKGV